MNFKKFKIYLDILPKYLFVISLCILAFGYGVATNRYKLFPYHIMEQGTTQLKAFFKILKEPYLWPIRYNETGVKIYNREKIMPGVTLLTSFWSETGWTAGIRLIDLEGKILHHWEVKPKEIWPQSPYTDHTKNSKNVNNNFVHGTYLYPNGDIIFNISFLGPVRMNSKGEVLWKIPYRTHHSVFRDDDGNFWVAGIKWVEPGDDRIKLFPGLSAPFTEETILKISPDGTILKEISVLESLYKGNYQHLLYQYNVRSGDLLHLNDVEVLNRKLAKDFPLFDYGDIVISSRHLNLIAVLDQSGKIKWLSMGIFTNQHDPDFEQNGWITVFDNRTGLGRTMIRQINPASNEVKTLYPTNLDQEFYTKIGGKHQKLNNGNRLITESCAGRVFEISPEGETVWEWIQQPFDEKDVPEVLEGTRYSFEEKDIAKWGSED